MTPSLSCVMQMHNTNRQRIKGAAYMPSDLVYLSTKNLTLPKGRAKKTATQVYWAVQGHRIAWNCFNSYIGAPTRTSQPAGSSNIPHEPDTGSCSQQQWKIPSSWYEIILWFQLYRRTQVVRRQNTGSSLDKPKCLRVPNPLDTRRCNVGTPTCNCGSHGW